MCAKWNWKINLSVWMSEMHTKNGNSTNKQNSKEKKKRTRKNNRAWTNRIHSKTKRIHTQTNKCIVVKLTAHMDRFLEHLNCAMPFHTLPSELTWTVFQPLPKFTIESHECEKYMVRNVRYWKRFCDFIRIEWFIQNEKKALELIQATFFSWFACITALNTNKNPVQVPHQHALNPLRDAHCHQ